MSKTFKRCVSFFLSFAFMFLMLGDLTFKVDVAADSEPDMKIILRHWHAVESESRDNETYTYTSAGELKDYSFKPNNKDDQPFKDGLIFKANTQSGETFSGFAVSAGNDAVTIDGDTITVKYHSDVPLVKIHFFYSEKPKLVPGTEMQVGTDDGQIGAYEDTDERAWGDLDEGLKGSIIKALGDDGVIDPDSLTDGDLIKLYNTSEGLHTDKTATPVYYDPDKYDEDEDEDHNEPGTTKEDTEENGTRVFDINLEAWYNDQATAKVGLILDASGSMAFISSSDQDELSMITEDNYPELKTFGRGKYLTPEQVNSILDTTKTDNSKLSYSDYKYYIYDTRDFTQEFVPLAYWGGNNGVADGVDLVPQKENLLGFWDFNETSGDNRQIINEKTGQPATVYTKGSSNKYTTSEGTDISSGNFKYGGHYNNGYTSGRSFALSEFSASGKAVALDVKPKSNTFTVSFIVGHGKDSSSYNPERVLFIGDTSNDVFTKPDKDYSATSGYNFYEIGQGDRAHLRFGAYNKSKTSRIDSVFDKTIETGKKGDATNDGNFHFVTMVFEQSDGKVKYTFYKDGELAQNNKKDATGELDEGSILPNIFTSDNFAMMLGGDTQSNNFKIYIDDLFLFDTALTAEEVEQLYTNVKDIDEKGWDAIGYTTSTNAYDDNYNLIATCKAETSYGSKEDRAGWYFVNSGSNPKNLYSDDIGTAKELCGLPANEVIKNEIDVSKLPISDSVLGNIMKATNDEYHWKNGMTVDEFRSESRPIGNGYIATSGENFTGNGYLWTGANTGDYVEVKTGTEYERAVDVPEGVERQYVNGGYSPCVFFVDDYGFLRCFYNNGGSSYTDGKYYKELRSGVSYVYVKNDSVNIKTEDLSYALGQFIAGLHNATPNTMLSAVRFSNQNVAKDYEKGTPTNYDEDILEKLVVLDWTSDTKEISQILSLERGEGGADDPENSDPDGKGLASNAPLAQYNYSMTGGTYTWTGFEAYKKFLDNRIDPKDKSKKYIILFTDGMDNMLDGGSDDEQDYAVNIANELKKAGYSIFCVVLKNDSFETGEDAEGKTRSDRVQEYMAKIAGDKTNADKDSTAEYSELLDEYIFEADDVEGLTAAFTGKILGKIASNLIDYTVQDYIDPRFDIIDGTGTTIVLGSDGKVTKGADEIDLSTGSSMEININNGETALLCYDSTKHMYYLQWLKQLIPGTTPGGNSLTVWSRSFRVIAKDDFVGGNAVLTNGNAEKMNWVFSPDDKSSSSGIGDAKVDKKQVNDDGSLEDPYVSKGFPRTTVNVRLKELGLYLDDIVMYVGEELDAGEIAKDAGENIRETLYWQYLARYYYDKNPGLYIADDTATAYEKALEDGIDEIIRTSKEGDGLTLPYYYLPAVPGEPSIDGEVKFENNIADGMPQSDDELGNINYKATFERMPDTGEDGTVDDSFISETTNRRKCALTVKFEADSAGDREEYYKTSGLINEEDTGGNTVYDWDRAFKPEAGTEQESKEFNKTYFVHLVKGEIMFGVKIDAFTYNYLHNRADDVDPSGSYEVVYNADLNRTYDGKTTEKLGQYAIKFKIDKSVDWDTFAGEGLHSVEYDSENYWYEHVVNSDENENYVVIYKPVTIIDKGDYDGETLPIGTYTVKAAQKAEGGEDNEGAVFGEIKFEELTELDSGMFTLLGEDNVTMLTVDHIGKREDDGEDNCAKYEDITLATVDNINAEYEGNAAYLGYKDGAKNSTTGKLYTDNRLAKAVVPILNELSALQISKEIVGSDGNAVGNRLFEFHVTTNSKTDIVAGDVFITDAKGATVPLTSGDEKRFEKSADGTYYIIRLQGGDTAQIVLNVGTEYTVEEVSIPKGYTAEVTAPDGATVESDSVKITGTTEDKGKIYAAVYTNTKQVEKAVITKTVEVDGGTLTEKDENTDFGFTVKLTPPTDVEIEGTYYGYITKDPDAAKANHTADECNVVLTVDKDGNVTNVEYKGDIDPRGEAADKVYLRHGETLVIYGIPEDSTVDVSETDAKGYTVKDKDGNEVEKQTIKAAPYDYDFTNTKTVGSLTISKTVQVNAQNDSEDLLTDDDKDAEFTFDVTLTAAGGGVDVNDTYKYTYNTTDSTKATSGTVTFDKGEISGFTPDDDTAPFKDNQLVLKHGESVVIDGLPTGATADVTEVDNKTDDYKVLESPADPVVIPGEAEFVNGKADVSLAITKEVHLPESFEGEAIDDEQGYKIDVTFTYGDENAPLAGTYTYSVTKDRAAVSGKQNIPVELDKNGTGKIELCHLETATISGLPKGVKVSIKEQTESSKGYNVIYSKDGVTLSDPTELTDKETSIKIDNTKNVGELSITKEVYEMDGTRSTTDENTFTFRVHLSKKDSIGIASIYNYIKYGVTGTTKKGTINFDNSSSASGEITLKNGEKIVIQDIPVGAEFFVEENPATGYESKKFHVIDGKETEHSELGEDDDSHIIKYDQTSEIKFKNTRQEGSLSITKKVVEPDGTPPDEDDYSLNDSFNFTVHLTHDGKNVTGKFSAELKQGGVPVTGEGAIDSVTFDDDGKGKITLKHGQTITISGLLQGTTCTIVEAEKPGYIRIGENIFVKGTKYSDSQDIVSKTIAAGDTEAKFTNIKQTANLSVSKVVKATEHVTAGEDDTKRDFYFHITFDNLGRKITGIYDAKIVNANETETTHNKSIKIEIIEDLTETPPVYRATLDGKDDDIILHDGDTLTISGLPSGITATVEEVLSHNQEKYTVSVTTKTGDETTTNEGKNSATVEVGKSNVEFTNTVRTVSLTIAKTMENGKDPFNTADKFVFPLKFMLREETDNSRIKIDGDYEAIIRKPDAGDEKVKINVDKVGNAKIKGEDSDLSDITLHAKEEIVIFGLPIGIAYEVYEKTHEDYTVSNADDIYNGTITIDDAEQKVHKENIELKDVTVSFVNTPISGSLRITKKVVIPDDCGDPSETDNAQTFKLNLKLENEFGGPLVSNTNYTYSYDGGSPIGLVIDEHGNAQIDIRNGQTVTITGLPVGAKCTVTETDVPSVYVSSLGSEGQTVEIKQDENGIIKTDPVNVTNTKQVGNLTVKKIVDGGTYDVNDLDNAIPFDFKVTITGDNVEGSYKYDVYKYDETEKTDVIIRSGELKLESNVGTITLYAGETAKILGLPVGAQCSVEETKLDGYESKITEDVTIVKDKTADIIVTNTKKAADLTISKTVFKAGGKDEIDITDPNAEELFSVIVNNLYVPMNPQGTIRTYVTGEYNVEVKDNNSLVAKLIVTFDKNGNVEKITVAPDSDADASKFIDTEGKKFLIKHGRTLTIKGLLIGTRYSVSEGNHEGYNVAGECSNVEINGTENTVDLANTRTTGQLAITKTVKGEDTDEKFAFTVKLAPNANNHAVAGTYNYTYDLITNAANPAAGGTVEFNGDGNIVEVTGTAKSTDSKKFMIASGYEVIISAIPDGTKATVTEDDYDKYTTSYKTVWQSSAGDEGQESVTYTSNEGSAKVAELQKLTFEFTNAEKTGTLTVSKKINNGDQFVETDVFKIKVKLENMPVGRTFTVQAGEAKYEDVTVNADGYVVMNGRDSIELKADGNIYISGLPFGTKYTVEETDTGTRYKNVSITPNEDTIGKDNADPKVIVKNTKVTGSLSVKKVVTPEGSSNDDEKFTINVTLNVKINGSYSCVRNGSEESVTFKDGEATIELAAGETLTIMGLPAGATYSIDEDPDPAYAATYDDNKEGVINQGKTANTTVTNTKQTGAFEISKEVVGIDLDETFTFDVTFSESGTYYYTIEKVKKSEFSTVDNFVNMGISGVKGTVELKNGQKAVFTNVPVGVTVTVSERNNDNYTTTMTINGESASTDGFKIENGKTTKVEVVNKLKTPGKLTIEKHVVDEGGNNIDKTAEGSFEFNVTLTKNGNPVVGTVNGEPLTSGKVTVEVGNPVVIEDLPIGTKFDVTEVPDDSYTAEYQVDDNAKTKDKASGTISETDSSVTVTVNNTKVVKTGILEISKYVDSNITEDKNKPFTFEVKLTSDEEGEVSLDGEYTYTVIGGNKSVPPGTISSSENKIELYHGQTATIIGIPVGTYVTVTETEDSAEGFIVTGGTDNDGRTFNGQIEEKASSDTADVTNALLVTFTNTREYRDISITKKVTNSNTTKPFKFLAEFNFLDAGLNTTKPGIVIMDASEYSQSTAAISTDLVINNGKGDFEIPAGGTVVLTNIPVGTTVTITEIDPDINNYNVEISADNDNKDPAKPHIYTHTITAADNDLIEVTYNNIAKTGDLTISKTLIVDDVNVEEGEFKFTVTFTDASGEALTDIFSTDLSGVTVTSGDSVNVKAGQSVTIKGLPAGTKFTVEETDAEDYTTTISGGTIVPDNAKAVTGTITENTTETVAFTNTKIEEPKVGTLTITKIVAGTTDLADLEKKFSFEITLDGDGLANSYDYTIGKTTGTITSNGNGVYTGLKLTNDQTATISGIPAGTAYTVTETGAENYTTSIVGGTTVTNETKTVTGTITENTTETVAFTNTKIEEPKVGTLTITKIVAETTDSADLEKEFNFEITLKGDGLADSYDYTIGETTGTITSNGNGVYTGLKLTNGQTATISGIPAGTAYTVTETGAENYTTSIVGGTTVTNETKTVTGTIIKDAVEAVEFTNTKIEEPKVGTLTITKTVAGTTDLADLEKEFSFEITLTGDGLANSYDYTIGKTTGTITSNGNGVYTGLKLTNGQTATISGIPVGTSYTVTEVNVDESVYTVGYSNAINNIAENGNAVTVTNTKIAPAPPATPGSLTITKRVTGNRGDQTKDFNFTVEITIPNSTSKIAETIDEPAGSENDTTDEADSGNTETVTDPADSGNDTTDEADSGNTETVTDPADSGNDTTDEAGSGNTETVTDPADSGNDTTDEADSGNTETVTAPNGGNTVQTEFAGTPIITDNADGNPYEMYGIALADTLADLGINITTSKGADIEFTETDDGIKVTITFTLHHGETITIGGIPEGADYRVSENPEGYKQTVTGDASGKMTAKGISLEYINDYTSNPDPGPGTDPDKPGPGTDPDKPGPGTDPSGPDKPNDPPVNPDPPVTKKYYDLTVKKNFVDQDGNIMNGKISDSFEFVITFGSSGRYRYTYSNGTKGTMFSGDHFSLRPGETVTIEDLPEGVTYSVSELLSGGKYQIDESVNEQGEMVRNIRCEYTNTYADPDKPGTGGGDDPTDPDTEEPSENDPDDPNDPDDDTDTIDSDASVESDDEVIPEDTEDTDNDSKAGIPGTPDVTEASEAPEGDPDKTSDADDNNPGTGNVPFSAMMIALAASAAAVFASRKKK